MLTARQHWRARSGRSSRSVPDPGPEALERPEASATLAVSTAAGAAAPTAAPTLRARIGGFVALTKPRIIELLLVTTVPTQIVAARGWPGLWVIVATVLGGTLAAGGAHATNMYVDRDIDRIMERTKGRPLVTGVVTPRQTLIFAVALEVVAFGWLWATVNLFSAVLAVAACLFYVFVYTLWLKRTSSHNIVIGGAAGAVPVLIGWTSVTGHLAWPPVLLFLVIVYWTPPHFWALAIKYREDYSAVKVPMLPTVRSLRTVAVRILLYTLLLWGLSLAFAPIAHTGDLYAIAALVTGAVFTVMAIALVRKPEPKLAMRVFAYSITYVTLLFGAMAVDQFVRIGRW